MRQNRFVCRLHAYNALTVSLTTIASGDRYVYKNAAARVLRMDTMLKSMQTVKWDCKDLPEQHNPYIDALRKELEVVAQRISVLGEARVPAVGYKTFWREVFEQVDRTFVEGFSAAKKCTSEGRALMQLDYRTYQKKMASLCTVQIKQEFVDEWIRAYYLQNEGEIEEWIKKHGKKYTRKQQLSIVNVSSVKMGKKDRQRLTKMVDDMWS
eukprot:m.98803 g.98803  ORF g.98803 m.98803 type:complete len:210 (+) comp16760_c0_seq6:176-805(+)